MIVFFALPMALTLVWSVFERTRFWMEPGFTLLAYDNFFNSARVESFLYSMVHSAIAVVISFVLGFPIAVFVRRRVPPTAQHQVILLFLLPFMISELIRLFSLRPVLGRYGLVNGVLASLYNAGQACINWSYGAIWGQGEALLTAPFEPVGSPDSVTLLPVSATLASGVRSDRFPSAPVESMNDVMKCDVSNTSIW